MRTTLRNEKTLIVENVILFGFLVSDIFVCNLQATVPEDTSSTSLVLTLATAFKCSTALRHTSGISDLRYTFPSYQSILTEMSATAAAWSYLQYVLLGWCSTHEILKSIKSDKNRKHPERIFFSTY